MHVNIYTSFSENKYRKSKKEYLFASYTQIGSGEFFESQLNLFSKTYLRRVFP